MSLQTQNFDSLTVLIPIWNWSRGSECCPRKSPEFWEGRMIFFSVHIEEPSDDIGSFDDEQESSPAFADQLTYWAVLLASACITLLGFWKLAELLM
ncbi:MAG: hypothetical protein Q7S99_14140 [Parvibaculum sp.]|nr:hypothetical protein [Parvibaculum sp.]